MTRFAIVAFIPLAGLVLGRIAWGADEPTDYDRQVQRSKHVTNESAAQLADALRRADEAAIRRIAHETQQRLGDLAGLPEVADSYVVPPADVPPLSRHEAEAGFERLLRYVQRKKWWKIGLDPAATEHLPREVAAVVVACTAGVRADVAVRESLLREAREAADFLIWCQQQGGVGVYPFPTFKGGRGAAFAAADRFLERAARAGLLSRVVRNGWAVDDLADGGLQFDNGLCGAAMFELYAVTRDERYLRSARSAADWAVDRTLVPNWNYNSFSVYLLAHAYRATDDRKYLDAAKRKTLLGVVPGQLTFGPLRGRWADAHNARPAYHYIMIRGLVALLGVLPADDPDRPAIVESVRAALTTRNSEFTARGIMNVDSSLEALLLVESAPQSVRAELAGCRTEEALAVIERRAADELRNDQGPAGPGVIGRLFEHAVRRGMAEAGSAAEPRPR